MKISKENITEILRSIISPMSAINIMERGAVSGIVLRDGGKVGLSLENSKLENGEAAFLQAEIPVKLSVLSGFASVSIVLTGEAKQGMKKSANWNREGVAGIKNIIAIAAGKGGVGKSTVAVNTAKILSDNGYSVGILDADIYGPSVPLMLGISGKPSVQDGKLAPLLADGIKCMSIGFLVEDGQPVIWRGPMIGKTITQFLRGTDWGNLDYLIVDMPPGTGDVQLSIAQQTPLDGVIMVTTPSELSLVDVRRCAEMFKILGTPILGLVENMSYFIDGNGQKHEIFGHGAGDVLCHEFNIGRQVKIPLQVNARPDLFAEIAELVKN